MRHAKQWQGVGQANAQRYSIQIDLNDFGDLRALLPLADTDLDVGTLGHAAMPGAGYGSLGPGAAVSNCNKSSTTASAITGNRSPFHQHRELG